MRASVPPPLTCKASALPSELIPLTSAHITREVLCGIVPLTKCFKVNAVLFGNNSYLENTGIDPVTSRMLSEHSTI